MEVLITLQNILCAMALTAVVTGSVASASPPAKPAPPAKKNALTAVVTPIMFFPQLLLVRPAVALFKAAHNLVFGPPKPQPAVRNKGVLVDTPRR